MKKYHDLCPRDGAGFCQIALRGHRQCQLGQTTCRLDTPAKIEQALDDIVDRFIAEGRAIRAQLDAKKVSPP
jgi:hypothetical protein